MKKIFSFILILFSLTAYGQDEINIDGKPCGMHGSSKVGTMEYEQNVFKNRYTFPDAGDFDPALKLENFVNGTATADKFNQNKAVEVTGYVYDVKKGGKETCNCKTTDPLFRDTHIELTLNDRETGPEKRFIIEVTPRIRQLFAGKGIDWTTESLKQNLKHHMIRIQGWLFYDKSHDQEDFANDPQDNMGKTNWRATCWEVHPITSIEILDETDAIAGPNYPDNENENFIPPVKFNNPPPPDFKPEIRNNMESTPLNTLIIILLGAILGMVGQGLRVVVGIKKLGDKTAQGADQNSLFKSQELALSLIIAFAVGAIAGVLAAIGSVNIQMIDKSTITAFISAGYAGTDFIEGFMRKKP